MTLVISITESSSPVQSVVFEWHKCDPEEILKTVRLYQLFNFFNVYDSLLAKNLFCSVFKISGGSENARGTKPPTFPIDSQVSMSGWTFHHFFDGVVGKKSWKLELGGRITFELG